MVFKDPWFLLLLIFVPLLFLRRKQKEAAIHFSSKGLVKTIRPTWRLWVYRNTLFLRMAALAVSIIALARPQVPVAHQRVFKEGIDIILTLDTSTSMKALDFTIGAKRYNRLYVVKQAVEDFIDARQNDRMGMIAFAGRPYVVCPLTLDHNWLLKNVERVKIGMVEDGTAIGSSIMAALNRLKTSTAKTKVIILLTDGRNNAGKVSPLTAAEAAQALGVKIYTIGAGSIGEVPYPVQDLFGRQTVRNIEIDIDESSLVKIAQVTGGKYFRATDTASLQEIYEQINRLETTPFKQPEYREYRELFTLFAFWALAFVILEQVLLHSVALRIP